MNSEIRTMKTQPRQNLTHQLTHDLGFAIVRGVYPVSEGLPSEADLCIKYNVSRSATREAVKMLSAKGLISSRPKQGIRVLPESSWNMFDTDAISATPEQLAEIDNALARMADADEGLDDPLEADIAFHTSILVASNNRFFVQLTEFISTALRVSIRYTNHIKGVPGADVTKHADILDTIKSGNPERAKKAVETILEEALELIESKLD